MTKGSRPGHRRLVIGIALAVAALVAGAAVAAWLLIRHEECAYSGCPSGHTRAFAATVQVDGYRRVDSRDAGTFVTVIVVGPHGTDIAHAVRAPGISLHPPQYPGAEPDERLILTDNSTSADWRGCTVQVAQVLPDGLYRYDGRVPADTLRGVRAGTADMYSVAASCEAP